MKLVLTISEKQYLYPKEVNNYIQDYAKKHYMEYVDKCHVEIDAFNRQSVVTIEGPRRKKWSKNILIAKRFKNIICK